MTGDVANIASRTEPESTNWRAVFSLSLGVVGFIVAEMLPASLLTPMASDLGVTEGMAGQAVTTTSFVALFSSVLMAPATRRFDRRAVLLSFAALLVISNLLVVLAVNYPMLLAARVLLGIGLGGFWAMATAVSVRMASPAMVPRALSIVYGGVSIGMVAAGPLGTYVGGIIGWRGVFLGTALLALAAFVWQFLVLPPMRLNSQSRLRTLVDLIKRPQIAVGNISMFLTFGSHFVFFTYLRPFLERVCDLGVDGIATIFLGFGVANLAGSAVAGAMVRRSLHRTLTAMPLLMAALAFGLVAAGSSVLLATVIIAGWGFAFGIFPVAWAAWMARAAPEETESMGGLQQAANQTAITAAAGIGGVLLDAYGPRSPFIAAGIAAILAAALILAKLRPQEAQRASTTHG